MFEQDKVAEVDKYTKNLIEEFRKAEIEYWAEYEKFDTADQTRKMTDQALICEALEFAKHYFDIQLAELKHYTRGE